MATVKNKGNLAEGILGAALLAKVIARSNGTVQMITPHDVEASLVLMKGARTSRGGKAKVEIRLDISRQAKDNITLVLKLGDVMMKELFNPKKWPQLQKEMQAAASYVNSTKIDAFAKAMYDNDIDNHIFIDVDGLSNSFTTKSDVTLRSDKYTVEKISLKGGAKNTGRTLGQVGGIYFDSLVRLWKGGTNPKTKAHEDGLGLAVAKPEYERKYMELLTESPSQSTLQRAVKWAYDLADGLFNATNKGSLPKVLNSFLQFHAARGDTDIKIVMFHLGKHKTLNPALLQKALAKLKQIKAVTILSGAWPIFLVYEGPSRPSTIASKNVLFGIRPKVDNRGKVVYIYHLVEEGPLFGSMIEEK